MRLFLTLLAAAALTASGPATAATGKSTEARIAAAFKKLGMKPRMSDCYGRIISSRLRPAKSRRAAEILESSKNGADVRKKVDAERGVVRGAFMAAKANCGLKR